jgi:hypothetical protein
MNREAHPYRKHRRFLLQRLVRVRHQDLGDHLGHHRIRHPLGHRHRNLDVVLQNQRLPVLGHQGVPHQGELPLLQRHLGVAPQGEPDDRLPDDPFPEKKRTGCCQV